MRLTSNITKALATLTVAGVLAAGGASAAFALDGGDGSTTGGAAATAEHPRARGVALRAAFGAAADALGMSTDELEVAVKDGPQSIASVAGDRTPEVVAAIDAALGARLDEAVANGAVSAARADRIRARIPTAAERFVNRVPGPRTA
jgi:hypothetical protein